MPDPALIVCRGCGVAQPPEAYYADRTRANRRRPDCRACDLAARTARTKRATRRAQQAAAAATGPPGVEPAVPEAATKVRRGNPDFGTKYTGKTNRQAAVAAAAATSGPADVRDEFNRFLTPARRQKLYQRLYDRAVLEGDNATLRLITEQMLGRPPEKAAGNALATQFLTGLIQLAAAGPAADADVGPPPVDLEADGLPPEPGAGALSPGAAPEWAGGEDPLSHWGGASW